MDSLTDRITELSPERRRLLQQLLEQRGLPQPDSAAPAAPAYIPRSKAKAAIPNGKGSSRNLRLTIDYGGSADDVKADCRRFYDGVSEQLNSSMFGKFSYFLNYGYVADESPELARVTLPEHFINRNSVKLVLELIGECELTDRHILDVGCGRGGTAYVLDHFFDAASITGIDLSPTAIAFCRAEHRSRRLRFFEADAEQLPFADASFDVATNLESSHTYPNVKAFYAEVARVLKPSDYFLYADVLSAEQFETGVATLEVCGLAVERSRNITLNVLLSCDEIARNRASAYASTNDPEVMREFLAIPGSGVYERMRTREWTYRILMLRKGHPGGGAAGKTLSSGLQADRTLA